MKRREFENKEFEFAEGSHMARIKMLTERKDELIRKISELEHGASFDQQPKKYEAEEVKYDNIENIENSTSDIGLNEINNEVKLIKNAMLNKQKFIEGRKANN